MRGIIKFAAIALCCVTCVSLISACENTTDNRDVVVYSSLAETSSAASDDTALEIESSLPVTNSDVGDLSSENPVSSVEASSGSGSQEQTSQKPPSSEASSSKNTSSTASEKQEDTTSSKVTSSESAFETAVDEETRDFLNTLDKSRRGWGQGVNYDEQNRPILCTDAEQKYGKYDAVFIKNAENKIYLTFDEGYEYKNNTVAILDTLKEKNVKAVFFITLSYAKKNPNLVRRIINEGHVLGNHSSTHPEYTSISLEKAYRDTIDLHNYVKENFGYEMKLFRFPSGTHSEQTMALIQKMGYKSIFWSYAYRDWETANQPDETESLKKLTERLHPGAVYLLHAVSDTNTAILGDFIDNIRKAGYDTSIEF